MRHPHFNVEVLRTIAVLTATGSLANADDLTRLAEALWGCRGASHVLLDIRGLRDIRWPAIVAIARLTVAARGGVRVIGPSDALPMPAILRLVHSVAPQCYDSVEAALAALVEEAVIQRDLATRRAA